MSAKSERLLAKLPSFETEPPIDPDALPAPTPRKLRSQPAPAVEAARVSAAEPEPAPAAPASRSDATAGTPASVLAETPPGERSAYFRSFYVSDEVFERFRSAIFWSSRNPQAAGTAPENMSVAIEDAMEQIATDLEQRYNKGETFPEPPKTRRRRRPAKN